MSIRQINVLIIDDNKADNDLIEEVFKSVHKKCIIHKIYNGLDAIQFLNKEGLFKDHPTPDLIILDLNLPFKTGLEVLGEIKQDKLLKVIPTVVYTSSEDHKDILHAHVFQANSYVVKSFDNIKNLANYWVKIAKLPTR